MLVLRPTGRARRTVAVRLRRLRGRVGEERAVGDNEVEVLALGVEADDRHPVSVPGHERATPHAGLGERGRQGEIGGHALRGEERAHLRQTCRRRFHMRICAPRGGAHLLTELREARRLPVRPQRGHAEREHDGGGRGHLPRTEMRVPPRRGADDLALRENGVAQVHGRGDAREFRAHGLIEGEGGGEPGAQFAVATGQLQRLGELRVLLVVRAVAIGGQDVLGFFRIHTRAWVGAAFGSAAFSSCVAPVIFVRSRSLPRASRDITVPMGTPRISAISLYE